MFIPNPTARFGEEIACKFLKGKGYSIVEKNFRKGFGELDIVAIYKNTLIFAEVKTRTTTLFGGAKEAITSYKLSKLIKTAKYYKMTHSNLPEAMRIDAVLISLKGKDREIVHIENITGF